jgi:hypothetical protein
MPIDTSVSNAIRIVGGIVPNDPSDTSATHRAYWGRGGFRCVDSISQRDAIPAPRREEGMWVRVNADGKVYELGADLTTWSVARHPETLFPARPHTFGTFVNTAMAAVSPTQRMVTLRKQSATELSLWHHLADDRWVNWGLVAGTDAGNDVLGIDRCVVQRPLVWTSLDVGVGTWTGTWGRSVSSIHTVAHGASYSPDDVAASVSFPITGQVSSAVGQASE